MYNISHTNLYTCFGVSLVLLLAALFFTPTTSHAAVNVKVVGGPGSEAQRQTVRINSQMRNYLQQLVAKEYNLDPQASAETLRRSVAKYNEMRRWLASGDAGNPFFIDNLELYQAGIRSSTMRNVFDEYADSNICGAFRDELIADMRERYVRDHLTSTQDRTTCTIEEILGPGQDLRQFLDGDFDQGSVDTLYQIGLNTEKHTPRGASDYYYSEAVGQANEAVGNALTRAGWGDGFKDIYQTGNNVMVCTQGVAAGGGAGSGDVRGIRDRCLIASPSEAVRLRVAAMNDIEVAMITNGDELQENAIYQAIDSAVQQVQYTGLTGTAQVSFTPPTFPPTPTPPPPQTPEPDGDPFPQIPDDPTTSVGGNFVTTVLQILNSVSTSSSSTNPMRQPLERTRTKLQYQLQTISVIDRTETEHASNTVRYQPYSCYSWTFTQTLTNERILARDEIGDTMLSLKKLIVLYVAWEMHQVGSPSTAEVVTRLNQLFNTQTLLPTGTDLSSVAAIENNFTQLLQTDPGIPNAIALNDIIEKFNEFIGGIIGDMQRQVRECDRIIEELRNEEEEEENDPGNDVGP